jgi:hypothetical protein
MWERCGIRCGIRCGRDVEMWERCGRNVGEMWKCGRDVECGRDVGRKIGYVQILENWVQSDRATASGIEFRPQHVYIFG